jgi:hypothetical protein
MYLGLWFDTRGCCPGRELHDIKAGRSQQGNRLPIHGRVCPLLVPAYVNAVGATADSITYFIGSIFFTAASFNQLLQAQTPAMTEVAYRDSFCCGSSVGGHVVLP